MFNIFGEIGLEDKKRITPFFVVLAVMYGTVSLLSNIVAGKIIMIGSFVAPAGIILFPICYIISDVLTECYGMRLSMLGIRMNAFINIFMATIFAIAIILPPAPFWGNQAGFASTLLITWRLVLASLIGTFLGDWANSAVVSIMKVAQSGKYFGTRAILSTIVGQALDSICFITIAFIGTVPMKVIFTMIICQYIFKVLFEVVCLPITCKVVKWVKEKDADYYDEIKLETYKL